MVHKSIIQQFLGKLVPAVEALKAGLPMEPGVSITALPEGAKKVMFTPLQQYTAHIIIYV